MTDPQYLQEYLKEIGITWTSVTAITDQIKANTGATTQFTLTAGTIPSNIDFSKGYSNLTLLKNLGSITLTNHDYDPSAASITLFSGIDITNIDLNLVSLTNISISNRNVCIKKSDLPLDTLNSLK